MVNGSGCPHQLNHILGIDGPQKPLTWFGDGEKELKEEKQRGIYDEERNYMDFEEDEEHISRGSDRKRNTPILLVSSISIKANLKRIQFRQNPRSLGQFVSLLPTPRINELVCAS